MFQHGFCIRRSNKLHEAPGIIFFMISQIKKQGEDVQKICLDNFKYNAFALLPENILYSMVKSDDSDIRSAGMNRILEIRRLGGKGRINKIMAINFNAPTWMKLINIDDQDVGEPGTTQLFTDEEIISKISSEEKLEIPDLPSHSQSVERSVKLVSEASNCVYGFESRHRHILAKNLSRKHRKSFISKGYYTQSYDDIFN